MITLDTSNTVRKRGKDSNTFLWFYENSRIVYEEKLGVITRQFSLASEDEESIADVASTTVLLDDSNDSNLPTASGAPQTTLEIDLASVVGDELKNGAADFVFEPVIVHGIPEDAIVVASGLKLTFYLSNGRVYVAFVEAPIQRLWSLGAGLLVEAGTPTLTRIFYIEHPLKPPITVSYTKHSKRGEELRLHDLTVVGNTIYALQLTEHDSLNLWNFSIERTQAVSTLVYSLPKPSKHLAIEKCFFTSGIKSDEILVNCLLSGANAATRTLQSAAFLSSSSNELTLTAIDEMANLVDIAPDYNFFGSKSQKAALYVCHSNSDNCGLYFGPKHFFNCCPISTKERLISLECSVATFSGAEGTDKACLPVLEIHSEIVLSVLESAQDALVYLLYRNMIEWPHIGDWNAFFFTVIALFNPDKFEQTALNSSFSTAKLQHKQFQKFLAQVQDYGKQISLSEISNKIELIYNEFWFEQQQKSLYLAQLQELLTVYKRNNFSDKFANGRNSKHYYHILNSLAEMPFENAATNNKLLQLISEYCAFVRSGAFDRNQWILKLNGILDNFELKKLSKLPVALAAIVQDIFQATAGCSDLSAASAATLIALRRFDWLEQLFSIRFPNTWIEQLYASDSKPIETDALQILEQVDKIFTAPKLNAGGRALASVSKTTLDDELFWLNSDEFSNKRFNHDLRLWEVYRMLCGSRNYSMTIPAHIREKDEDFQDSVIQAQLVLLAERVWATPLGRAALSYAVLDLLERNPVPQLVVSAANAQFKWTPTLRTAAQWADFHQGVAAALKLAPSNKQGAHLLPEGWLSMQRNQHGKDAVHGGFLLGLGLNGHLEVFDKYEIYRYLTERHVPIMIGCVLGLTVSQQGTGNPYLTQTAKCDISYFVTLPFRQEIQLLHTRQIAAMVGLGWLYCGLAQRDIVDGLLEQLLRKEHLANDVSGVREQDEHFLIAGLSVGLVYLSEYAKNQLFDNAQEGESPADMSLIYKLVHLIEGYGSETPSGPQSAMQPAPVLSKFSKLVMRSAKGTSEPATSGQRCGAALALSLAFLKSNNSSIANFLTLPGAAKVSELDSIRADTVPLFVLAKLLVLWNSVEPTAEFFRAQVPLAVIQAAEASFSCSNCGASCALKSLECSTCHETELVVSSELVEYAEDVRVCYHSCRAGCALALGIKYAGTNDKGCRELLFSWLLDLQAFFNYRVAGDRPRSSKILLVNSRNSIALALGLVLAGTGDVSLLRIIRRWHYTLDKSVSFSTHVVAQLVSGWLFLGNGAWTFSSANDRNVAGLLCAVLPLYPGEASDCSYFFPALRHFWVLAAEPRCLVTRNVLSRALERTPVAIKLASGDVWEGETPCVLPPIHSITSIELGNSANSLIWPVSLKMSMSTIDALTKRKFEWCVQRKPSMEYAFNSTATSSGKYGPPVWSFNEKYFLPVEFVHGEIQEYLDHVLNLIYTSSGKKSSDGVQVAKFLQKYQSKLKSSKCKSIYSLLGQHISTNQIQLLSGAFSMSLVQSETFNNMQRLLITEQIELLEAYKKFINQNNRVL